MDRINTKYPFKWIDCISLTPPFHDLHYKVIANAAFRLSQIGPPATSAIPALKRLLEDTNESVHLAAREALRKIDPAHFQEADDVGSLIQKLKTGEGMDRFNASMKLRTLGTNAIPALPALWNAFTNLDAQYGFCYAETIWTLDPEQKTALAPCLIRQMQRDELNPQSDVDLLGKMKVDTTEVRAALRATLNQPQQALRQAGAYALLSMGNLDSSTEENCWKILIGFLETERNWMLRHMSAVYLGRLGPAARRSLPELKTAPNDSQQWVREEAQKAIELIESTNATTANP